VRYSRTVERALAKGELLTSHQRQRSPDSTGPLRTA
jgi:hypothetical protein